jgi:hypothetical protein
MSRQCSPDATPHVFTAAHWLEMAGIDAAAIAAEVVEMLIRAERPTQQLPTTTVRGSPSLPVGSEEAIARVVDVSGPVPATGLFINLNLRHESGKRGLRLSSSRHSPKASRNASRPASTPAGVSQVACPNGVQRMNANQAASSRMTSLSDTSTTSTTL